MSVENLSFQHLSLNPTSSTPSITLTKEPPRSRKTRNRQYVPSDDEDDEDDDEDVGSDDEFYAVKKTIAGATTTTMNLPTGQHPSPSTSTTSTGKPHKKVTPLPSDDEDEDDDELDDSDDDDDDQANKIGLTPLDKSLYRLQGVQSTSQLGNYPVKKTTMIGQRHSAGESNSLMPPNDDDDDDCVLAQQQQYHDTRNNTNSGMFLTDGSQLQQWQYMQQYHQAQMAQFHQQQPHPMKSHSSSHLRHQYQQQQQHALSGMELMAQLEQDKAEAKRQKPKLNPTNAKIEGLLAKLPEPGAHNISFQQQQQQHYNNRHNGRHHGRSSHIMMMPQQQQQQQGYMPMMMGAYNMYGYPYNTVPYPPQPPRTGSPMGMNK
ncbi:hypothetical protein BC941DRAFT_518166 [Chlamydoabsidia padenii]|nr:hypothetical protein BC941DRAFT_518166 [Chlamydoabsidia padenii]